MSQPQVNVIRVLDPFDPSKNTREAWELDPNKPKTLRDFFPVVMVEHVVSINGKTVLDDGDNFSKHYVQDGDSVVICPVPTGGGGDDSSKAILRLVAMIAVMVVAWYVAPMLFGAYGGTAVAIGQMGIVMVGGMLVNSLLPNKPLGSDFGQQDPGNSPTYGIDGAKNTSLEGIPVPVVYGHFRYAGNIIGLYTQNYGEYQDLFMLFNAGEGYVAGLDTVEINGQPYWNYQNVEIDYRYGWENQSPPRWFDDTVIPNNVNQKLTNNWTYWSTNNVIDRVRFDLLFPTGLYQTAEQDGRKESFGVGVD
jgi:predicted phage tail protein